MQPVATFLYFIYCTFCVLSGAFPFWPCVYAYSPSEGTETKHEVITQFTLWPLFKLLPWQYFQKNHVIYGVLMRTLQLHTIWLSTCNAVHLCTSQLWQPSSHNTRVTFKTHFLYMLCLGSRRFEVIWNIKFLLKLI